MSRIGKKPIDLPQGVDVIVKNNVIQVKGSRGQLERKIDADFKVTVQDGQAVVERPTEQKRHKALHGLYRSLINNMVLGVNDGFQKELELVGVGYKAVAKGQILEMSLGYSHSIFFQVPTEVKVSAETVKGKNPVVKLDSNDKELIGQVAAKMRELRKIEPYKGKGIRFVGEEIRRKAGKTASK